MAIGFRNPLTPLGFYAAPVVVPAGFRAPIPVLGLYAPGGVVPQQSDYKTRRMFLRGLSNR